MELFGLFKRKSAPANPDDLHGKWHLVRTEGNFDTGDGVTMEFRDDGTVDYCIKAGEKLQIMKLVFHVEGAEIVTDQPSTPSEQRTRFAIDSEGLLLLDYGGSRAWFTKTKPS